MSKYGVYRSSYGSEEFNDNDKGTSKNSGNKGDRSYNAKNWLSKLDSNIKFNDAVKKAMSNVFYFDNIEVSDNIQLSMIKQMYVCLDRMLLYV